MIYLNEQDIKSLLTWDDTYKATEVALQGVSSGKATANPRLFTQIFNTSKWMMNMPGYLNDDKYGGWACKIITGNPLNGRGPHPLPLFEAHIMLFHETTGVLQAIFAGVEITNWRTAAASAVATKYLYTSAGKPQKVLSIFGCGDQGKAHAECFYHCFQFEEIRLWNRTTERAENIAKELNSKLGTTKFKVFKDREACSTDADVIVTATAPSPTPIIISTWLKEGIHINAVGVIGEEITEEQNFELEEEIYRNAQVYVDSWNGAKKELKKLKEYGADMKAEVGEVILGKVSKPAKEKVTIFQSLGMAAEDCAMARLVYDLHLQKKDEGQ